MTVYTTNHAIERALERLKSPQEQAKTQVSNWLKTLMQTATYVGDKGNGRIFDHPNTRTRLVLDKNKDVIVTVYGMDDVEPSEEVTFSIEESAKHSESTVMSKVRATIRRELTKAQRQFTREFRTLAERQALVQIEIAQLTLNKARAKNPNTQARIQSNIDVALGLFDEIGSAISELQAEFERTKREAQAFLQPEVTA
jgi:uncharacterized small protein (DUF1192 family)